MPRNTLTDLNNHLFVQLERLNDEELSSEKLQEEIARAKAISGIAAQIISNGSLVLRSQEFLHECGMLESADDKKNGDSKNKSKKGFPPMLKASFLGE